MTTLSIFFMSAAITLLILAQVVDKKVTAAMGCNDYRMATHYNKVSFVLSMFGCGFALAYFTTFLITAL
jgi:hypothetical protein